MLLVEIVWYSSRQNENYALIYIACFLGVVGFTVYPWNMEE